MNNNSNAGMAIVFFADGARAAAAVSPMSSDAGCVSPSSLPSLAISPTASAVSAYVPAAAPSTLLPTTTTTTARWATAPPLGDAAGAADRDLQ